MTTAEKLRGPKIGGRQNIWGGRFSCEFRVVLLRNGPVLLQKLRLFRIGVFMRERPQYMADIVRSIELLEARAARMGTKLCVRMNGSTGFEQAGGGSGGTSCLSRLPNFFRGHVDILGSRKIQRRII
jgi:hypothetical protein